MGKDSLQDQPDEEVTTPMEEYYKKYQSENLCKIRIFESPKGLPLFEYVTDHASLFSDMLFRPDSLTTKFVAAQVEGTEKWENAYAPMPHQLEYFDYAWFVFEFEDLGSKFSGKFSPLEYKLSVAPKCMEDDEERDVVILHELIHLHETVLDALPTYYHEAVLYCLYKDLRNKIPDLDNRIEAHGHMLNQKLLSNFGGKHDMLFLLKSFDLDLSIGKSLGTVFRYDNG